MTPAQVRTSANRSPRSSSSLGIGLASERFHGKAELAPGDPNLLGRGGSSGARDRAPSTFSGLPRRFGKERPDQRAHVTAAALGTLRLALLALADGQGQRYFLLALVTEELVERHGPSSSRRDRFTYGQLRLTTTDFTSVYSAIPS